VSGGDSITERQWKTIGNFLSMGFDRLEISHEVSMGWRTSPWIGQRNIFQQPSFAPWKTRCFRKAQARQLYRADIKLCEILRAWRGMVANRGLSGVLLSITLVGAEFGSLVLQFGWFLSQSSSHACIIYIRAGLPPLGIEGNQSGCMKDHLMTPFCLDFQLI